VRPSTPPAPRASTPPAPPASRASTPPAPSASPDGAKVESLDDLEEEDDDEDGDRGAPESERTNPWATSGDGKPKDDLDDIGDVESVK
jgi:hypothetical protein